MFLPSRWKFPPSLKLIGYDHPLPSYCCWYVAWPCDLDLWPFDLGQWSYMAGHVFNPSTKFEDPTAICSWVMSSDISTGYHWQCVCSHYAWAVSRNLCIGANFSHIFEIPDPDLPNGATIKTNGDIRQNSLWPYVKDRIALCACAKSRQPWTLP